MATTSPAVLAGMLLAALHFAGALKTAPAVAGLSVDATLLAALLAGPALLLLGAARRWRIDPAVGVTLAAVAALALWMGVATAWSPADRVAAGRLPWLLAAPLLVTAGLVAGAEPAARRGLVIATLVIGPFAGWAVLDGLTESWPDAERRVPYQSAGLALAAAGGLAALGAAASRGVARAFFLLLLLACAVLVAVPGGRAALLGLLAAAVGAPALFWLRQGRTGSAVALALAGGMAVAGAAWLLDARPDLAEGFRTLERLTQGNVGESSARLPLWRTALALAGEALPFGGGTGAFPIAAGHGQAAGLYPHNHLLEALAEGGLPAALLWLLAWGAALAAALRSGADPLRIATLAALVLPVLMSIQVSSDLGNRLAWVALGLLASAGISAERRA